MILIVSLQQGEWQFLEKLKGFFFIRNSQYRQYTVQSFQVEVVSFYYYGGQSMSAPLVMISYLKIPVLCLYTIRRNNLI